jgi:hypothetical protein
MFLSEDTEAYADRLSIEKSFSRMSDFDEDDSGWSCLDMIAVEDSPLILRRALPPRYASGGLSAPTSPTSPAAPTSPTAMTATIATTPVKDANQQLCLLVRENEDLRAQLRKLESNVDTLSERLSILEQSQSRSSVSFDRVSLLMLATVSCLWTLNSQAHDPSIFTYFVFYHFFLVCTTSV